MKAIGILAFAILLFSGTFAMAEGDWKVLNPANRPPERFGHSMVTLPDGRVLLFGGENSAQDMYNDLFAYESGQWSSVTPSNSPPGPRKNHCTWYGNGKVYVHGGKGKTKLMTDVWGYDPDTKEWLEVQTTGPKPSERYSHTATVLSDNTVLLLGGRNGEGIPLQESWRLNVDNTYTVLAAPPMPLSDHVAQAVNDIVFVFGEPDKTFTYNVATNQWTTLPTGPSLWGYATSSIMENKAGEKIIFVFGGIQKSEYESNIVYEYNTTTMEIKQREEFMPFTHSSGAAAALKAQDASFFDVLFFGGKSNNQIMNTTFQFSISSISLPGDINGDNAVNLADVLCGLKVLSGGQCPEAASGADISGDRKIGVYEVLYGLQAASGLRSIGAAPP